MAKDPLEKPQTAIAKANAASRDQPKLTLTKKEGESLKVDFQGDWKRIAKAAGHGAVTAGLMMQATKLGTCGDDFDEGDTNFIVGFVDAMEPRDAAEALLFTQMATLHQAMIPMAMKLKNARSLASHDSAERALSKLARGYAAQMDTLKRYRSKGQQTVRVERVTVESGAQAVVGDVTHGGEGQ